MKINETKSEFIPVPLYNKILRVLPIVCVDLLVINEKNEILLLKRKNDPAKGEWWFPGGRVYHGEQRMDAAKRKLFEECGLRSKIFIEMGTYDCLIEIAKCRLSHAVTTLYKTVVKKRMIHLDEQSKEYEWTPIYTWQNKINKSWPEKKMLEQIHNVIRQTKKGKQKYL
jgi:colanic acid biosynthesis protein WcaH